MWTKCMPSQKFSCIDKGANPPGLTLHTRQSCQVQLHEVLLKLAFEHGHALTPLWRNHANTAIMPVPQLPQSALALEVVLPHVAGIQQWGPVVGDSLLL